MRILTIGFEDEFVKQLEVELAKYFICMWIVLRIYMMLPNLQTLGHYGTLFIIWLDEESRRIIPLEERY